MLLHPSLRQPINLEQQQLFNFLMRVWLLDLLCPTATKGWNGNLQIVCFYGTFFNVVVPAQWPQQMQFSLACNVYTPPSKARTHRTQSSYPNNPPISPIFFISSMFLGKTREEKIPPRSQSQLHKSPFPQKNIMAQSRTLDREERALAPAREQPLLSRNGKIF